MDGEMVRTPREEYEQEEQKFDELEDLRDKIDSVVKESKLNVANSRAELKADGKWNKAHAMEYKTAETIMELAGKIAYGVRSIQVGQSERRLKGLRDQAHEEAVVEDNERRLVEQKKRGEIIEAHESAIELERRHEALQRRALAALEELSDFEEKQLGYARPDDSDNKTAEKPENSPNFE